MVLWFPFLGHIVALFVNSCWVSLKAFVVMALVGFSGMTALAVIQNNSQFADMQIRVSLNPENHHLEVQNRLRFKNMCEEKTREILFVLHSDMSPVLSKESPATLEKIGREKVSGSKDLEIESYKLKAPCDISEIEMFYGGKIFHPSDEGNEDRSGSGGDTPGIIDTKGVFLASSSYWFPRPKNNRDFLISFDLQIAMPNSWIAVSQGKEVTLNHWNENNPQEDIYLIAYPFQVYRQKSKLGIELQAFLREANPELAKKYLAATEESLVRYQKMIGPYPYQKFALVENFWDTGYGMPSFTLLGSNIIKLPFVINTSYPHEILHDWWGNGVYVEGASGNWCEGITSYMADHLQAESSNQGDAYRRDSLQKYTDFVNDQNDFPLSKFRSRFNAPSEAIGYSKALMFFHVLRLKVGDSNFKRSFSHFYQTHKFTHASYSDIRNSFVGQISSDTEKQKIIDLFAQWTTRPGAPELKIKTLSVEQQKNGEFQLKAEITQIQKPDAFVMDVPIYIHLENERSPIIENLHMATKSAFFEKNLKSRPTWFEVDPRFDSFRRLAKDEVPPALTMALGGSRSWIVIPSNVSQSEMQSWQKFAQTFSHLLKNNFKQDHVEIIADTQLTEDQLTQAPKATVWILGQSNRWVNMIRKNLADQNLAFKEISIDIDGKSFNRNENHFVMTSRDSQQRIWAFVSASFNKGVDLSVLANKIVHYGKYGYLVFESGRTTNVAKGSWQLGKSSMSIPFLKNSEMDTFPKKALYPKRPILDEEP